MSRLERYSAMLDFQIGLLSITASPGLLRQSSHLCPACIYCFTRGSDDRHRIGWLKLSACQSRSSSYFLRRHTIQTVFSVFSLLLQSFRAIKFGPNDNMISRYARIQMLTSASHIMLTNELAGPYITHDRLTSHSALCVCHRS